MTEGIIETPHETVEPRLPFATYTNVLRTNRYTLVSETSSRRDCKCPSWPCETGEGSLARYRRWVELVPIFAHGNTTLFPYSAFTRWFNPSTFDKRKAQSGSFPLGLNWSDCSLSVHFVLLLHCSNQKWLKFDRPFCFNSQLHSSEEKLSTDVMKSTKSVLIQFTSTKAYS